MKSQKARQITRVLMITLLLAVTMPLACSGNGNYLEPQEKRIGTDSDLDRSFHVVADEPQGFGLRMEGFLIGIEKSSRKVLDVPSLTADPHLTSRPEGFSQENTDRFLARLDDGKRTFVSHLVQAKLDDNLLIPYIRNRFLYDAYLTGSSDDRRPSHPAWTMKSHGLYERSWKPWSGWKMFWLNSSQARMIRGSPIPMWLWELWGGILHRKRQFAT